MYHGHISIFSLWKISRRSSDSISLHALDNYDSPEGDEDQKLAAGHRPRPSDQVASAAPLRHQLAMGSPPIKPPMPNNSADNTLPA